MPAPAHPLIRIAFIGFRRIDAGWSFTHRRSPFWRIYHDPEPGAAVLWQGARITLDPDHLVVIPPEAVFSALPPERPVAHRYLHVLLDGPGAPPADGRIHRIPVDAPAAALLDAIPWESGLDTLGAVALAAWTIGRLAPPPADDAEDPVLRCMRENLHRHLGVAELARIEGCSVDHFIRRFTRRHGTTPGRWLAAQRIALARHLLAATAEPVESIAGRCGFASRGHLTTAFTRATGQSPARYRAEAAGQAR